MQFNELSERLIRQFLDRCGEFMKIYVDADACPVKDIIVNVARKKGISVVMVCDTSHIINDGYSEVVTVDKERDSADIALVNRLRKNDIVVTQDYGVGCLAISKGAFAINQNGMRYNDDNIDRILFERFLSRKVRSSGGRVKNIPKRNAKDNLEFEKVFVKLIDEVIVNGTEEN